MQYYCRQLDIVCYASPLPVTYLNPEAKAYPSPSGNRDIIEEDPSPLNVGEDPDKKLKPILGFLPPLSTRSAQLTRVRKSKSKKTAVRGLGAS